MVEIDKGNFKFIGYAIKMMMIEMTHSSTSVLFIPFEVTMLGVLKGFFKEHFLIFIRSLSFGLYSVFDLF